MGRYDVVSLASERATTALDICPVSLVRCSRELKLALAILSRNVPPHFAKCCSSFVDHDRFAVSCVVSVSHLSLAPWSHSDPALLLYPDLLALPVSITAYVLAEMYASACVLKLSSLQIVLPGTSKASCQAPWYLECMLLPQLQR